MTQNVVKIIGSFNSYADLQAAVTAGTVTPTSGVGYTCLNPGTVSTTLYPPGNYAYSGSAWFRVADKLFDSTYSVGFTGTTTSTPDKREWLPCAPLPHRTFFLSSDEGVMSVWNGTSWTEIE